MTTPPSFPTLTGQGWSVLKSPRWSTIVAPHVSGREVRVPNFVFPLYDFALTFNVLDSDGTYSVGFQSQQTLMGFYGQAQGQFGTFLYTDPTDNSATNMLFAEGDGATTAFTVGRSLASGPVEPVGWVTSLGAVYLNGVAQAQQFVAETSATGSHSVFQSLPYQTVGTIVVFNIYALAATRSALGIFFFNGAVNLGACSFNLATGAVGTLGAGFISQAITAVGGGWYQCQVVFAMGQTGTPQFQVFLENPFLTSSYAGTTGDGIYIAGANWAVQGQVPTWLPAFSVLTNVTVTAAAWSFTPPNTLTFTAAPLGVPTVVQSLVETSANGLHDTNQSVASQTSGLFIVFNVYLLANARSAIGIICNNGSTSIGPCNFNLATGAVGTLAAGFISQAITAVGGGWYQCQVVFAMAATGAPNFEVVLENPFATDSYVGTTGSGVYIAGANWGVQGAAMTYLAAFSTVTNATLATITPSTLPALSGADISATFTYAFQCRFAEDALDFEETMNNLWQLKSCKFQSVRSA